MIEEVERYHAMTISSIVDVLNARYQRVHAAEEADRQRQHEANQAHRQHIDDVTIRIGFDGESKREEHTLKRIDVVKKGNEWVGERAGRVVSG